VTGEATCWLLPRSEGLVRRWTWSESWCSLPEHSSTPTTWLAVNLFRLFNVSALTFLTL
jgi:hypothetical protein